MILIGLIAGLLAVAVVPPIVTFDGPSHYLRTVQLAERHFRATVYSYRQLGGTLPRRYGRFVNELWTSYWTHHTFLNLREWSAVAKQRPGDSARVPLEFTNTAVYSGANYLPQVLGMGLVRPFSSSPLALERGACIVNLLFYLALIVLVLETVPAFQSTLLLIATSPLLLIQASSISADPINFAVPLCVFALVWKLRAERSARPACILAGLTVLAIWTALLKPTEIVLLGFLLFVPTHCFRSRARRLAWVAGTVAVSALMWFLWNHPYSKVHIMAWFEPNRPPLGVQRALLMQHPVYFLTALNNAICRDMWVQWKGFYAFVGGWVSDHRLQIVYNLSYVFAAAVLLECCHNTRRDLRWAGICLLHAAGLLGLTALTMWLTSGVGPVESIPFFIGRYLFLVFTLLLVAWAAFAGGFLRTGRPYFLFVGIAVNLVSLGVILLPAASQSFG